MSDIEKTLEQLEAELAAAESAREQLRGTIESLELRLSVLPQSYTEVLGLRRKIRRRALWITLSIPLALAIYHLTIRPTSDFDREAQRWLEDEIGYLRSDLDEAGSLHELEAWAESAIERRNLAELPSEPAEARGREPYPAFRDAEHVDQTTHDGVLRWGNLAIAACRVDERPLALHAMGVLRWLGTTTENGLPAPRWQRALAQEGGVQRTATDALAWAMTQCMVSGVHILPGVFDG